MRENRAPDRWHDIRRLLAVAALLAITAAGCGSSGYGRAMGAGRAGRPALAPSLALLHGVPAAAARTLTQRALIGWRLDGARVFGPVRASVYGNGAFDLRTARGREVIDLPELRHQEPGTEHLVFLPTKVYLQPKAQGLTVLSAGKRWVSASLIGSEAVNTNFPGFLAQIEGVNPVLLLSELEWGTTAAVPLGPGRQIVDHVPAQRYRVAVDLSRALATAGGPHAAVLSQAIQEQLVAGGAARGFLTWVDRQGRVVQVQTSLAGTGDGTELLALSYFGSRVGVTVPAGPQVIGLTSLTPSGERENNGGGDSDGG